VGTTLNENLFDASKAGKEIKVIDIVAKTEGVNPSFLLKQVASGRVVVMQRDGKQPLGIGNGLRTKVNANIGTSSDFFDSNEEAKKAKVAERYGADTVTDLSMGGPVDEIRRKIFEETNTPLTTVPIYQAVVEAGSIKAITECDLVRMIKKHIDEGISSIVVHAGFTLQMLEKLKGVKRIMGMVSKGGSFTSAWMLQNNRENPFLSRFDEICGLLADRDVVISLGNTMRSGCIHDAMDGPQDDEINMNAELARRANAQGVQVIVGGMGGALAAGAGADYLCYITPSEHLALPNVSQVREGVVAFKIAAHIGDTLKYGPRAEDKELAECRRARDWESQFRFAIDGDRAREMYRPNGTKTCSMCGKYCAIAIMEDYLR
jgi:phosphomethylpyrimidine synthase